MSNSLLNQIFYISNKFDNDLTKFAPYMLIDSNITHMSKIQPVDEPELEIVRDTISQPQIFSPNKEDTLFWCIYVVHHGEAEYSMLGGRYKNSEVQEKQNVMNYMLKNHSAIKTAAKTNNRKISNVRIQEIEAEFMINKKTSWHAFWFMCIFYKINAIMVQDNIYMEFMVDTSYPTYQFNRTVDKHVSVDCIPLENEIAINKVRGDRQHICPFNDKLLNGVSTYKLPELVEIGRKLKVSPETSKPKKNDWYNVIIIALTNMNLQN